MWGGLEGLVFFVVLWSNRRMIKDVLGVLKSGGVVMHPTETSYGLAVDIFDEEALQRLYEVKGRDFDKPVSILVRDLEMAEKYGEFGELARELAKENWPGPVSIVVKRRESLPDFFNEGWETVSFRVSSDEFTAEMVDAWGGPLTTTSANKAGDEALYYAGVLEGVDYLVDGGEREKRPASRILKVVDGKVTVLRK